MIPTRLATTLVALVLITNSAGVPQAIETRNLEQDALLLQTRQSESRIRDATGMIDVTPDAIHAALSSLESQREAILIDLAAKTARMNELDRQIKLYRDELQARMKADPVAAELEKVVEPLEKAAERKRSSPQAYSPPDIERADMEVSMEKTHLLERREQFGDDSPMLEQLKHDRIALATDLAELRARARVVNDRAEAFDSVKHDIAQIEQGQNPRVDRKINAKEM